MSALPSTIWHALRRRVLPLSFSALLAGALAGPVAHADLPAAAHIWVLAVNGSLTVRDAGTLRFMGQGPVASAMAVSANRKRVFGMEAATGRVFEIHPKTLAPTPVVEIKQPLSGLCASPDGGRLLLLSNA